MESTLIHRNLLRGQHIPKDKCTQNCMLFMIEGELLINSDEHPGTTLHEKQFILQAIGSKYEILALTDVSYILSGSTNCRCYAKTATVKSSTRQKAR